MVFSVVVNRVVSVENIGLKPDCDIYANNVIAFCLYFVNKMRGNVINMRRNVNTDDVIDLCLHLVNKTRSWVVVLFSGRVICWTGFLVISRSSKVLVFVWFTKKLRKVFIC